MKIGVSIGQAGRLSTPAALRSAAAAAEQVGYATVWVEDRLHWPGPNANGTGNGNGNGNGPHVSPPLDPLLVLALAASVTSRVRLGTGVLAAPCYQPEVLARSLGTLDVLSEGRLVVGLDPGSGGASEGLLDLLVASWPRPSVAAPASGAGRQPPLLLSASTASELDRIARRADGWIPVDIPVRRLPAMWAQVRDLAAGQGRDPDNLLLVPRATVVLTHRPLGPNRASYHGSFDQVVDDLAATSTIGADEAILGLAGDPSLDEALDAYARLAEAMEPVGG